MGTNLKIIAAENLTEESYGDPSEDSVGDLLDSLIDNWIVDVPYLLAINREILQEIRKNNISIFDAKNIDILRRLYQASKRYYFIHENTIVYGKEKPIQLYTALKNKIQEDIYLFPHKEGDFESEYDSNWCMNYFMVLNPYLSEKINSYNVRINGRKINNSAIKFNSIYELLWKLSLKTTLFSVDYIHKITGEIKLIKFNKINNGPCLSEFGYFKPYEIDTDSMVKACSVDLFSIEKRNLEAELEVISPRQQKGQESELYSASPPRDIIKQSSTRYKQGPPIRGQLQATSLVYPKREFKKYVENLIPEFPKLRYSNKINPRPPNTHWGQVKLLFSEIEFLVESLSMDKGKSKGTSPSIVVYAGAASGQHIPILARMFPTLLFILYDPEEFAIKPSSNIIIRREYFTDEIASLYSGMKALFISDIRRTELDPLKFEQLVEKDNETQKKWAEIMDPYNCLFKFRLPFLPGTSRYLDGVIKLQCFAPPTSAETRLIPYKGNNKGGFKEKIYSREDYENQLFYFNVRYRNRSFLDLDPVFGVNYDAFRAYNILSRYLEFTKLIEPNLQNIKIKGIYILGIIFEIEKKLRNNKISHILKL